MSFNLPPGSWPGSYHVVDFVERMPNTGAEASIVFEGPSSRRHELLRYIFPYWRQNESWQTCCSLLVTPPIPYPDLASKYPGTTGSEPCEWGGFNLWPDTFEVGRGDDNCVVEPSLDCDPTGEGTGERPLVFGDGKGNECSCRITVNYRRKYHGTGTNWAKPAWPSPVSGCWNDINWQPPHIPVGTYINVRQNPTVSGKLTPKAQLKYQPDKLWSTINDYANLNNCDTLTSSAVIPDADWCDNTTDSQAPENDKVDSDLSPDELISSKEVEIIWSGVPDPQWPVIDSLQGKVNSTVWLSYPPESVLFETYDYEEFEMFGGVTLYNIRLKFLVETVTVDLTGTGTPSDTGIANLLRRGIFYGRMGIWNRIWSDHPMFIDADGENVCCTNWVPVVKGSGGCCTTYPNSSTYRTDCFSKIFNLNPPCDPAAA